MNISVIIVNYNTCDLLRECIDSIIKNTTDISYEIIVVDNASLDGSVEMVRKYFEHVIVVCNDVNVGFGKACNLGVDLSKGDFVFFLNTDAKILNNALLYFHSFANSKRILDSFGAVGCMLLNQEGHYVHSYNKFPQVKNEILRIFKLNKLFEASFDFETKSSVIVDYITGASLFIKRTTFISLGGFDSSFFMYYEETDLQKRMAYGGLLRYIIEGPKIVHLQGRSFSGSKPYMRKLLKLQSMFLYHKRHSDITSYWFLRFFYVFIYLPLSFIRRPFSDEISFLFRVLVKKNS